MVALLAILALMPVPPRPFHLGFTPFPHDISIEAVDFAYNTIAKDADLIVHSLDDGIPWEEAYSGREFPKKIRDDWQDRVRKTPKHHTVYVQLNPLNLLKNDIAKDTSENPTGQWEKRSLDDPKVKQAFLNYCERAIDAFHPTYLGFIECNLLKTNSPSRWPQYVQLHQWTYRQLKTKHPKLQVFNTFVATAILDGYAAEHNHANQLAAIRELAPYNDVFAISLYPYMSRYMAESLPENLFDDLKALNPGKPMAIAESGYPAAEFSIQKGKLVFRGTPEKQANFIRKLLAAAQRDRYLFINNYILRDYEPLWEKIGKDDLSAIWKNTGLYSADGQPRPALKLWKEALARSYEGS